MNYFKLAYTTPEVIQKIEAAEAQGRYNEHLDPVDYDNALPVDESFAYVPEDMLKWKQGIQRRCLLAPFAWFVNRFVFRTKVYDESGFEAVGQQGMIITCNHVNKLDSLVVKHALRKKLKGREFKVMVADFNNQKGRLGEYMRAFGILPFPSKYSVLRRFNQAVSSYLSRGAYILFFPEQSEWWCYEKPRPLKDGAFYYAVKNNVAVLPLFITFTKGKKTDENGIARRRFHVHILKPIYPRVDLSQRDNIAWMREENARRWEEKYDVFYKLHEHFKPGV